MEQPPAQLAEEQVEEMLQKPEKILLAWQAYDRPYKRRGIGYYFNIALIAVIIFLILVFFHQYALIGAVCALVFVGYVLAAVKPNMVEYQITTKGIRIAKDLFAWDMLQDYWPQNVLGHNVYIIPTTAKLVQQLVLMYPVQLQPQIVAALNQHLKQTEPPKLTWFDKRANDLVRLVNIGQK